MTRRCAVALATVLAAVLVGCGSTAAVPAELGDAAASPAAGAHRVTCRLHSAHGNVLLALDLPRGFLRGRDHKNRCLWHLPVRVPDDGNFDGDPTTQDTYASDVVVTVATVRKGKSLQDVYDELEPDAVEGDRAAGDDSLLHLSLRKDVKVFGATRGDRLSWLCFCDGQNLINRYAQADGIRLTWGADLPLQKATDRQLEAVLRSVGKRG